MQERLLPQDLVAFGFADFRTWLICWAGSMAEVSEVEGRLRSMPGVERAGVVMRLRVDFAIDRVEGWIREELAKWVKAARGTGHR